MKEITVTIKPAVDFSNAKVGDNVFCILRGLGKIEKIRVHDSYPIHVAFINNKYHIYLFSGHAISGCHEYASLYYFNPETQEVLYSRPEPEINWTEYEEKMIEVRDTNYEFWCQRVLWKYDPQFQRPFVCYALGDKTSAPVIWKQARLIKED